ncbi:MAG: hypothetical protein AMS27_08435 [Bacteroides sp. SM23_62_1]|nr:MAG: hypothetical protein AMS27_08435 [Bacteroides sp. SM23_62_1]
MKRLYYSLTAVLLFLLACVGARGQWADFYIDYFDNCEPVLVTFTNLSDTSDLTGNAHYNWHVDGMPYVTWDLGEMEFNRGYHTVEFLLWDDGGFSDSYWEEFEIYGTVKDFKISTGPEACPGAWVNFWIENDFWSTEWDFGDGSFKTTDSNPSHQYFLPGIYDITLIAYNECGVDTVVKQITISNTAKPLVEAYTELGIYCINDEVIFHANEEFEAYSWKFGDGQTSTEKDPSHFYDTQVETLYTVTLTATNSCGNSNTDTVIVQFADSLPAEAWFDYYSPGTWSDPCPNVPVQFNARVPGTYEWDFGDGSVAFERDPKNIYAQPGDYLVTLYATNGCGNTAEHSEWITVMTHPEDYPYVDFMFDVPHMDWDEIQYLDTLEICPGELVRFNNQSWSMYGGEPKYNWNFGDGQTSTIKNASHVFASTGLYPVTLTATTLCGGTDFLTKYVLVSSTIYPEASLGVVPRVICDGELVFFFDEEGDFDEKTNVYNIDFGDGEVLNNITEPGDTVLYTLANHAYTGAAGSTFIYTFSVKNQCGNSVSVSDTIRITDDPLHKPFYYVENSSEMEENQPMDDWGKRKDPSDHQFNIMVSWSSWYYGLDTNFYVFFWYGGFDPMGEDPGPVDGFVHFTSQMITSGQMVSAYIPIDPLEPPVIGMAAGWSCSGIVEPGIEPDAWGMPMDGLGNPITALNLIPAAITDLQTLAPGGIMINPDWSGICLSEMPFQRSYYEVDPNNYVQLEMWQDDMSYDLYGSSDPEGWSWLIDLSWGDWQVLGGNEIMFTDWYDCAEMTGNYTYTINGDTMEFTLIGDYCPQRVTFLTGKKFIRKMDYGMTYDMSGCPGDDVLFKIAGGISYEWHFGDGFTSNLAYPKHAYSAPGIYDAYVIATNACGRIDTIFTRVTIKDNNLPNADFWADQWDAPRYEPIQFMTGNDWLDQAGNYAYLWNFGDGATSTAKNPSHAYERNGDYIITLKVTNGCGTSTNMSQVWIQDAVATCNAKFDFIESGDTVTFTDLSWGEPTSWFWDFGDGFTSTQQNPIHIYSRDGVYFVCLSIFDESTDCASQICREVPVGSVGCRADFRFTVNEALNSVRFTDVSTNAQEWFWSFGDGSYSSEQNPTHTYSQAGLYFVYLATYNSATGCFAEVEKEIQIGADQTDICYADFSFFVDEANKKVVFTDKSSANITDWYWTFGDGTYISQRHPEHIYPKLGIYEVCLIVFDQYSGSTAEICKKVPVGVSTCNINADFSYFIDISTNAITFNDKSTGSITKWFWNFGDGTTSSKQSPKHVYTQPGFYLVTLSVTDATNACTDHVAEFVQVGTVDCRAFYEYNVDAADNKVTFVNKSQGNISEYFWFFGDGSYSVQKDPVHNYDFPGLYFVELTVVDASGLCMDYYFEPIQVGNLTCQAKFSYFIDSLSNVAYFTPDAIGDVTDYLWFFGDGSISVESAPVHVFTQPGYFTVGLNTFDAVTGCMDFYEEIILIGRQGIDCRADFMYMTDPTSLQVSFTNSSKGNIVYYVWNFGERRLIPEENLSKENNPKHTYLKGGYYYVCLTVMNNFGITNTKCEMIQVAPGQDKDCLAKFIYTVDSTTLSVRFIDKSFGKPDGWFWNFDDGGSATTQNPVHNYTEPGFYMVNLSTANSTTNCTSRTFKLINVGMENQGLETDFSYDIDSSNLKADSYPVDFIGVSLGDGNKLKWTFGDGTQDTTSLQPTHEYTAPGTYTVCLTISNPVTEDSDTKCEEITVGLTGTDDIYNRHTQLGVYPNPFRDITNIIYHLTIPTDVDLSIFDNSGRKIETLVKEYKDAGQHVIEYNGAYLDSGVYHLRLVTKNQVITSMMIVR